MNDLNNENLTLEEKVVKSYQEGVGTPTIFKTLQPQINSVNAVLKILEDAGVKRRKAKNQQGASGTRVLTPKDDQQIAELYLSGKTTTQIFNLFKHKIRQSKSISDSLKRSGVEAREKWEYTSLDHFFFSTIDSEAKAYFLGWLITDGWVQEKTNEVGLQVQAGDEYILHLFKETLKAKSVKIIPTGGMFRLAINSPIMKQHLEKYGVVPRKTHLSFLPYLKQELMPDLIRGLIDGDGCIHITPNGKVHINLCGTFQLCSGLRQYLVDILGVSASKISPNTSIFVVTWTEESDVKKIKEYIWKSTIYTLPRKSKLIMENL